jgi:hypothetical protein
VRPLSRATIALAVLAAAAGFAFTVVCYVPGYLTSDPIDQLTQARRHVYSDWHPPLMAWLWGQLDRIFPGPAGMLVFHAALFWGALTLVALSTFESAAWLPAGFTLVVGLLPPVFSLLGTIWKDVGMAAALLLAFGLLLHADRRGSRTALVLAVPALFYAFGVRHNAVIAVAPLVVWFGLIAARPRRRLLAATVSATLTLSFFALSSWINYGLLNARHSYPTQQILVHDLAAVSIATKHYQLPEFMKEGGQPSTMDELGDVYTPQLIDPLFCCDDTVPRFNLTYDKRRFDELAKTWARVIPHNLKPYLAHRAEAFRLQLAIGEKDVCFPFQSGTDPNPLGLRFQHSPLNTRVTEFLTRFENSLLFRGWFYLAVSAAGLLLSLIRRGSIRRAAMALAASGFLYGAAYFFIGTTCDFRMAWWTAVSAIVLPAAFLGGTAET